MGLTLLTDAFQNITFVGNVGIGTIPQASLDVSCNIYCTALNFDYYSAWNASNTIQTEYLNVGQVFRNSTYPTYINSTSPLLIDSITCSNLSITQLNTDTYNDLQNVRPYVTIIGEATKYRLIEICYNGSAAASPLSFAYNITLYPGTYTWFFDGACYSASTGLRGVNVQYSTNSGSTWTTLFTPQIQLSQTNIHTAFNTTYTHVISSAIVVTNFRFIVTTSTLINSSDYFNLCFLCIPNYYNIST